MKKLMIILAAIAMVGAFTATTMAADWSFYGSARIATFWETEADNDATDEEADLAFDEHGNSRVGARVKVSDSLSGRFEAGEGWNQRLLYGTWNFGAGAMTVGQFYAPGNIFISNQVYDGDTNLLNMGGLYTGRQEGIQLKFGGFKIAFLEPQTGNAFGGTNTDVVIPKIEAAYTYAASSWWIQGSLGVQSYNIDTAADDDIAVNSNIFGVGVGFNFGPAYVNGNIIGGTNVGNYGIWSNTATQGVLNGDEIDNTSTVGVQVIVGYTINDMMKVEGGFGQVTSDNDNYDEADSARGFYVQLPITLASGVSITPELGTMDQMKNAADADEGSVSYFGAKWMINF